MSLVADTVPSPTALQLKRMTQEQLNRFVSVFDVARFELDGPYAVIRLDNSNILCIRIHTRLMVDPDIAARVLEAALPIGELRRILKSARGTFLSILAKEPLTHKWHPCGTNVPGAPAYLFKSHTVLGSHENISMISDW